MRRMFSIFCLCLLAAVMVSQPAWAADTGTLEVQISIPGGTARAFSVSVARVGSSARTYQTTSAGLLRLKVNQGTYSVKPVTSGFTYSPASASVYVRKDRTTRAAFSATAAGGQTSLAIVAAPTSLSVPEGGKANLTVRLSANPGKNVTVAIARSGDANVTVSPAQVVLGTANYAQGVAVAVAAAEDADTLNGVATLTLSASGASPLTVTATEADNDQAGGGTLSGSHKDRLAGLDPANVTATCISCHQGQAQEVAQSVHYRWLGPTQGTSNLPAEAGKMGGINDFCIYPDINWIGKLTNLDGKQVDGGCAKCHAGLGAKPSANAFDQANLENIDCLVCHSAVYKRTVVEVGTGVFRYRPDEAAMGVSATQAAADITKPDRARCLSCHLSSGGGPNFKRGDIEAVLANPSLDHDVHMSASGGNLQCTSCHKVSRHTFAGRGSDLRVVDNPAKLDCTSCHAASPHDSSDLNKHTAKVNCTVCHIDRYAKASPTDILRDYTKPGVETAARLFEPDMQFALNQTPAYRWYNGTSSFYVFGERAVPGTNGRVLMSGPNGGVNDAGSKLFAFKYHQAKQPIDPSGRLLPLKIGLFFQSGQVNEAIKVGTQTVGWTYTSHSFADTERYLGLFHGVSPTSKALKCASCHTEQGGTRLDFAALGYTPKNTNLATCSSGCHGSKSGDASEWKAQKVFFTKLHKKHVTDKKYDCAKCHSFSRT
jgi:hypothetical protein